MNRQKLERQKKKRVKLSLLKDILNKVDGHIDALSKGEIKIEECKTLIHNQIAMVPGVVHASIPKKIVDQVNLNIK